MANIIVELKNVYQRYGDKVVLEDFNFQFEANKITAVLGKSGGGKSTLLQLINGTIKPNAGEIKLYGQALDYDNIMAVRQKIGFVFQFSGLFPHLSIENNITLLANVLKRPKEETNTRLHYLLEAVCLPKSYLNKFPYQLSGGEQQRVGLCRAFFLKPPLILMDEPFASLDYDTKNAIYDYIQRIRKDDNLSIILVTHQFEEAQILADNYIWMDAGKIKVSGNNDELIHIKKDYTLTT
jgi:osmoprotectant transport system ATP-binding protein